MKTDVLVVGAGPVGLTMAAELKRYGLSVRLVEKLPQATDKSKALVVWSRTLELLDRMGCSSSFVNAGFKVTAANFSSGKKTLAHLTLSGVESPHPFALMIPQSDTERLMADHLTSLGVTVERNLELIRFTPSNDGVQSTLRHADGREETMESSWLIGCDGAHSTVRHGLGMEFEGDTTPSDWVLADVHLSGVQNPGEVNVIWHAEGVLVLFPITQDRYRVIADVGIAKDGARRPDPTLEEMQAIMDQRGPGGITMSTPIWLAAFRINERKVADYRKGRVLLAGDAAHIHSPAGGQGMNTGMQDACNLAWKLALVSRGICAESPLLDSYTPERGAVGEMVLKGAGRVTMIATMKGGVKQAIRNHIAGLVFGLHAVREKLANAITELSVGYPHSPLNAPGGKNHGPKPGERAPIRTNETPVGAGDTPRFAIFTSHDAKGTALLKSHSNLLEQDFRKPFHEGGLWLVRPDGYVAVATSEGDWDAVSSFLAKIGAR
jgi:2-polyprenyl-6-methoxyphenol hydroxylase-like FAD-dependent oxidoreductase